MHLPANPKSQKTRVGWVGHSTVLISFSGTTVLTAPNFSRRIKIARRLVNLPLEPEDKMNPPRSKLRGIKDLYKKFSFVAS